MYLCLNCVAGVFAVKRLQKSKHVTGWSAVSSCGWCWIQPLMLLGCSVLFFFPSYSCSAASDVGYVSQHNPVVVLGSPPTSTSVDEFLIIVPDSVGKPGSRWCRAFQRI